MKITIRLVISLIIPFLILIGCGSDGDGDDTGVTVYTVGSYGYSVGLGYEDRGCYWVNNERKDLEVGSDASAITLSGGKVYVAGSIYDSAANKRKACYWIDGVIQSLDPPTGGSDLYVAKAIAVSDDGTVYTVGTYDAGPGKEENACYWKDEAFTDLVGDADYSYANGIAVSENTVYIAGSYEKGGVSKACYWIGSDRKPLENDYSVEAIAVSDNTIYMAGYSEGMSSSKACYWINENKTDLTGDAGDVWVYAGAITVSGGKVYIAGTHEDNNNNYYGYYWMIGGATRTTLDLYSHVSGIAVLGNVVYTAGYYTKNSKDIPCYWEGTERVELDLEGIEATFVEVNGIAVK